MTARARCSPTAMTSTVGPGIPAAICTCTPHRSTTSANDRSQDSISPLAGSPLSKSSAPHPGTRRPAPPARLARHPLAPRNLVPRHATRQGLALRPTLHPPARHLRPTQSPVFLPFRHPGVPGRDPAPCSTPALPSHPWQPTALSAPNPSDPAIPSRSCVGARSPTRPSSSSPSARLQIVTLSKGRGRTCPELAEGLRCTRRNSVRGPPSLPPSRRPRPILRRGAVSDPPVFIPRHPGVPGRDPAPRSTPAQPVTRPPVLGNERHSVNEHRTYVIERERRLSAVDHGVTVRTDGTQIFNWINRII